MKRMPIITNTPANSAALLFMRFLVAIVAAVSLAGCAIQLAPDYDAQLLDGLTEANKEALVLFAKVEAGSAQGEFAKLSDEYANVIASFEALGQRADARQNPPLASRLLKMKAIASFCDPEDDPASCVNATASAVTEIVGVLRMLRDRHKRLPTSGNPDGGLLADDVTGLRLRYDREIHQALTVETALKR